MQTDIGDRMAASIDTTQDVARCFLGLDPGHKLDESTRTFGG